MISFRAASNPVFSAAVNPRLVEWRFTRSQRYWADLDLGILTFDSREQIAELVGGLDKPAMLEFVKGIAARLDSERLLIYNQGKFAEAPIQGEPLGDVDSFKRG